MKTDERALVDTNVLVYAVDMESDHHESARALLDRGIRGTMPLCVSVQVLLEFFAIVTNPKRVSTPCSPEAALKEMEKVLASNLTVVLAGESVAEKVIDLCREHPVKAQGIFDLQLVATMLTNGITRMYTYNVGHFRPFSDIEVLTPESPR